MKERVQFCLLLGGLAALVGCSSDRPSGGPGAAGVPGNGNVGGGVQTGGVGGGLLGTGGLATIGGSGGGATTGGSGSAAGTGGSGGTPGPDSSGLPGSYNPTTYAFPEPDDGASCNGTANATAKIAAVFLAQTHALSPEHPLFFLVANRPALLEVPVTGAGAAPEVRVEGLVDGVSIGALCLTGPAVLSASVDASVQRRDDRFTVTLPSLWLRAGLSLKITAGAATRTLSAAELRIGPAPELDLIMVSIDVLNYNAGKPDQAIPQTWVSDFAGAMPASVVRFARFPARMALPQLAVSADGNDVAPQVLSQRPCGVGETPADGCQVSDVSGMNVLAAVKRLISALHRAAGDYSFSYYYGNTEHLSNGGWGTDKSFVGSDYGGIFLHEMGHALDLPHWGEGPYQNANPTGSDYRYPYGGADDDGGGRGESWNYYQNVAEFVSPLCQIDANPYKGGERSDAMYRSNACPELRSSGPGPWDGFGDFSALAMFRYMTGADAYAGTVPYRGGSSLFRLKPQQGWPNLVLNNDGSRSLVRAHQPTELSDVEKYDFLHPVAWDVPVATVYGSFRPGGGPENLVYAPLTYEGNLPRLLDPTDPQVFAELAAAGKAPYDDYFWWPKDLTIKVTYEDGQTRHGIYPHESFSREWASTKYGGPWRGDLVYFALNFPGDKRIDKVEVFERPFLVRYAGYTDSGNINHAPFGITAESFMAGATLRSTWTRP